MTWKITSSKYLHKEGVRMKSTVLEWPGQQLTVTLLHNPNWEMYAPVQWQVSIQMANHAAPVFQASAPFIDSANFVNAGGHVTVTPLHASGLSFLILHVDHVPNAPEVTTAFQLTNDGGNWLGNIQFSPQNDYHDQLPGFVEMSMAPNVNPNNEHTAAPSCIATVAVGLICSLIMGSVVVNMLGMETRLV